MRFYLTTLFSFFISLAFAQDPSTLPLLNIHNLEYQGGFRMPAAEYGASNLNYSEGPIEYNADNHSLFIVSHSHEQAIGEFAIPEIVNSEVLEELNMTGDPIQNFSQVLDRAVNGNTQNIDRIGGMEYINHTLLVNAYQYYDASGSVTVSTLKIENSDNLASSDVNGYFSYDARAGNSSGWLSPIPLEWQQLLNGSYITGQSSGIPIISRTSVGPTAYSFFPEDFDVIQNETVPTSQLLDFSYPNGLHEDLYNSEGGNDIWTHLSRATYGFIVPGTRTYLTIGKSGGHVSGVCYKCTQDNGNLCGGYCTPLVADNYQYYWLWDMNDLVEVKNGERAANDVQPYEYGQFNTPFQNGFKAIGGGTYDPESNKLYLAISGADRAQGTYSNPPVIVVYEPILANVVPVEWINFEANIIEGAVELEWEIENSVQNEYFEIERELNNGWEVIGRVNSSSIELYHFQDRKSLFERVNYRIKQIDYNGDFSYSKSLSIDLRKSGKIGFAPNPVEDILFIYSPENDVLTKIYSLQGALLLESKKSQIEISNLTSGIYIASINDQFFKIVKN